MIKIAVSFPLIGRDKRQLKHEKPKEFYYGTTGLSQKYKIIFVDSRVEPVTVMLKIFLFFEKIINRITSIGFYRTRVFLNKKKYKHQDIIISFTDLYSLNLGLYYKKNFNQSLVGVFHGLSDIVDRSPLLLKTYFLNKIKKSLENLDHIVFFGETDLIEAKRVYKLNLKKTHLLKFGVDHNFWREAKNHKEVIDVLCVGSDMNRDYEILKTLSNNINIRLLTTKKIDLSKNKNIKHVKGNIYNSNVSDEELRHLYHCSKIILIPLHDVFQPSGTSVTLQAMSCGKLVIISKIKGIFDKNLLKNDSNISFVKPNCSQSLQNTIDKFIHNENLRKKIGSNARKTVEKNFTLKDMSNSLEKILGKV